MNVSRRRVVSVAVGSMALGAPLVVSRSRPLASTPSVEGIPATLDGLVFQARILRDDRDAPPPLVDRLTFADGAFSSEICTRYGFAASPYWLRPFGGEVQFLTEMHSPSAGTMVWQGRVRGRKLDGTMRWQKRRWYWTIDLTHRIHGEMVPPADRHG